MPPVKNSVAVQNDVDGWLASDRVREIPSLKSVFLNIIIYRFVKSALTVFGNAGRAVFS